METQIFKGNIVYAAEEKKLSIHENSYIVVEAGVVTHIYKELPDSYRNIELIDYSNHIIIPGFVDLHVHAPQFNQIGIGLDCELIDWLNKYTFKLESKFIDEDIAKESYSRFVDELALGGTLRSSIFATIHLNSTKILCSLLREKGLGAYVGKVNMDCNSIDALKEDTAVSLKETEEYILEFGDNDLVKPIITPRFAPTSTKSLLLGLGKLADKYKLPVQSHLDENVNEIKWVEELFPECQSYSHVYDEYGLFGQTPTLMAHGVYISDAEIELIKKNKVLLVHCPDSNLNIASGIMKVRKLLDMGIDIALGSDVGGGHSISMTDAIVRAVQLSKVEKVFNGTEPLTLTEAFYMATKGSGSFFGKVGSFEEGYEFDALVIKQDKYLMKDYSIEEQWQQFIYSGDNRKIVARYVKGKYIEI